MIIRNWKCSTFSQERKESRLEIARPCQLPNHNGKEWIMKPVEVKVQRNLVKTRIKETRRKISWYKNIKTTSTCPSRLAVYLLNVLCSITTLEFSKWAGFFFFFFIHSFSWKSQQFLFLAPCCSFPHKKS